MKISLGSDHAGFRYKEKVKELLGSLGHEVKDFGTFSEEPVDYPLFIRPAAEAVARGECDRGIVFGGSGNGEAVVANKVHGVRCALCWNEESARLSRHDNDANALAIRERLTRDRLAPKIDRSGDQKQRPGMERAKSCDDAKSNKRGKREQMQ